MNEELKISTERVDDIPLLLEQMQRLGVAKLLDEHFPRHGNWQGLSLGQVAVGWLSYIVSEGDHRLSHVQSWVEQRRELFAACLAPAVRAVDFSDDRLGAVLDDLSDERCWGRFERALTGQTLRVYELAAERVRVDSTSAKGYVAVSPEGLFQFGHSKDYRPDLPQVKINVSVLDPLGLPLSTTVVSGNRADDPLYIPEIQRVQQMLSRSGVLYIGDSKMAALETRAYVVKSGDYYLCPLSRVQLPEAQLQERIAAVERAQRTLTPVYRAPAEGERPELIAEGYEYLQPLTAEVDGEVVGWSERRLVVRSFAHAQRQEQALRERLARAGEALSALTDYRQGKKRFIDRAELQARVESLITQHQVEGLLEVDYGTHGHARAVRRYRDRPPRVEVDYTLTVSVRPNPEAVAAAVQRLGWRVYAAYHPSESLSLAQAVLAYRAEYLVERGFGRLKGKALALTPLYLNTDARVSGLIRLLSIGLRVLSVVEFQVRQRLQPASEALPGLYAGNPQRATTRPTAELLLRAFQGLTLTLIRWPEQVRAHLTPLTALQQRILGLLQMPLQVYQRLVDQFSEPILNLRET